MAKYFCNINVILLTIKKETIMVKPIGVVAMLILLTSGPALAGEKVFTKHINVWAVSENGNLYLETKRGERYKAEMQECSTSTIQDFENPNLSIHGRFVRESKTVAVYDAGSKRSENVRCKLGQVTKIS